MSERTADPFHLSETSSEPIRVIDQRGLGPVERRGFEAVAPAIVPDVVIEELDGSP